MMEVPSTAASSSNARTISGFARSVNRPSTRRKACWRSAPNLLIRPKNWCVSVILLQASAKPAASSSASGLMAAFGGALPNAVALSRSVNWLTMSLNAVRSVSARTNTLWMATPCASKNCRLCEAGFFGSLAGSNTAKPACQRLKNRRRSISSPSARPMWPLALMFWYTPVFSCTVDSLRVSAITGPHNSSACSSSTQGPLSGVALSAKSCDPVCAAMAWPSLKPRLSAASFARLPLWRAA